MRGEDLLILKPAGALDHSQVLELETALADPGRETAIILDFRNVTSIDSGLINFLINFKNRFPRDYCKLKIVNPRGPVMKILEAVHLNQVFETLNPYDA